MALPIKETPILRGKDAEEFHRKVKENENKKVSREEYEEARRIHENVMKNARK